VHYVLVILDRTASTEYIELYQLQTPVDVNSVLYTIAYYTHRIGEKMTLPTVPLIINGAEEYNPSASFAVTSPYTNQPCWTAAAASPADALRAVDSASAAFPTWSATKPAVRRDILLKAADILEKNLERNAGFMRAEMGADVGASQMFVAPLGIRMLRDLAGRIASICGSVPVVEDEGQSAMVVKEPMGVILGIVPW
jgi:acyl-CoA reductase-like NAD-dependent aldehyde dehydrogenase